MKLLSFGGVAFASLNVHAGLENDTPDRDRYPLIVDRIGAAGKIAGITGGAREIPVYFWAMPGQDIEQTLLGLIAALDPDNPEPRPLVGQLNDGATTVQCRAWVGSYVFRPEDQRGVRVTFYTDDPRWSAASVTTDGPTSFAAAGSRTFTVAGHGRVRPLITVSWSVNRPSSNSRVGWTYRRQITVTNNSGQSLRNYPIQLGPFDHAALVTAGKSQATGQDVVVFDDRGQRLRRQLIGANSVCAFLWFVVDELLAGTSRTYDVCYGNPNATHDPTNNGFPYSYFGSPAIDITGISGTCPGGATTNTMPTGQSVEANAFVGATVIFSGGSAGGGQMRKVVSHDTSGVMTVGRQWYPNSPTSASTYTVIRSGLHGDGGAVSAATATTLTDSAQSWNPNEWIGATVEIITTGIDGGTVTNTATVVSNTATTLTVDGWSAGTPSANDTYRVWRKNGKWIWHVEQSQRTATNHRGRWRLNRGNTKPSQVWGPAEGAPAAWAWTTYNPGNAKYDYAQNRYTRIEFSGDDDYFAILDAWLARKDGANFPLEGFANGCEIAIPLGVLGVRHDFKIRNPGGMARAVFGCREQGGEDWELYREYSGTHSTLTTQPVQYVDLTPYGRPIHLLAALTSDDDGDVADTELGAAILRDGNLLEAYIDTRDLVVTDLATATEEAVYDLTLTIRRGGSSEGVGDDVVRIGGESQHLFLAATEEVRIGPQGEAPFAARVYAGASYVRDVPYAVRLYRVEADANGQPQRVVSAEALPLPPGSTTYYVTDQDGAMGTVAVQIDYVPQYY